MLVNVKLTTLNAEVEKNDDKTLMLGDETLTCDEELLHQTDEMGTRESR